MSDKMGYGIIRLSFKLGADVMPEAKIDATTTQGKLRDDGYFFQVHERLMLPESYEILGIYLEFYRLYWCILVKSPEIPLVDEGAELPHITPYYRADELNEMYLERIVIEPTTRVLRID